MNKAPVWFFFNTGRSLPIMNRLDEEQWRGAFTYNKGHNQNYEKKTVSLQTYCQP